MVWTARIAMILSWGVVMLIVLAALWDAMEGNPVRLMDMVGLPAEMPTPPVWAQLATGCLAVAALAALGSAYWRFERVLRAARQNGFDLLARELRLCGGSLIIFYVLFMIFLRAMPFALLWEVPPADYPEIHWFPIDIDMLLLVIGIVLIAIANSFARAAEVDDENRHFL